MGDSYREPGTRFACCRLMKDYTIYCLARGVRLLAAQSVEASDDEQALGAAGRLRQGTKREVWDGSRLVGRIEVDPLTADLVDLREG